MEAVYFPWVALAIHGEEESQSHGASSYKAIQPCRGAAEPSAPAIRSMMRSSNITLPSQQELEELFAAQKDKAVTGTRGGTFAQKIKKTPEN